MEESRNADRVLVGRPEGNRPLGSSRRRLEDNIKMDLKEVGCEATNSIGPCSRSGPMADLCKSSNERFGFLKSQLIMCVSWRFFPIIQQEDPLRSYSLVSAIVCLFVLITVLKFVEND